MFTKFWPAKVPNGHFPNSKYMGYVAAPGAGFVPGAVLAFTAGLVDVAGADPAAMVGVASAAPATSLGNKAPNAPTQTTGIENKVPVYIFDRSTIFAGVLVNGSAVPVIPTDADVGVSYGITAFSNIWYVDKAKTGGSARVKVWGFDSWLASRGISMVYFKPLEANLALP